MQRPGAETDNVDTVQYSHSLNRLSRKKALERISAENQAILRRIQAREPVINHLEFEAHRMEAEKYLKNIMEYKPSASGMHTAPGGSRVLTGACPRVFAHVCLCVCVCACLCVSVCARVCVAHAYSSGAQDRSQHLTQSTRRQREVNSHLLASSMGVARPCHRPATTTTCRASVLLAGCRLRGACARGSLCVCACFVCVCHLVLSGERWTYVHIGGPSLLLAVLRCARAARGAPHTPPCKHSTSKAGQP